MALANPNQKFQDWFTQQWVILRGARIDPQEFSWLLGPVGNLNGIGAGFVTQLAEKEGLIIDRTTPSQGLIPSIDALELSAVERQRLSEAIVGFYEHTSDFNLDFSVKWNPAFKGFGVLLQKLFSRRINQLNIPSGNSQNKAIRSEIITLRHPESHVIKYTIWLRTVEESGQVIYSGVYGTTKLPSGKACVKAVFPLPNGNATVLLSPSVNAAGALILDSAGRKAGDAGFYFLLQDSKGTYWTRFLRSFRDRLVMTASGDALMAEQTLSLWRMKVLTFKYFINNK